MGHSLKLIFEVLQIFWSPASAGHSNGAMAIAKMGHGSKRMGSLSKEDGEGDGDGDGDA